MKMEEEAEAAGACRTTSQKSLKRLNLNIPLLSVRRHGGSNSVHDHDLDLSSIISRRGLSRLQQVDTSCSCIEERVPFSWEHSPGKPKLLSDSCRHSAEDEVPPKPKPPPGRRRHNSNYIESCRPLQQLIENFEDDGNKNCGGVGSSVDVGDMETHSLWEAIDVLDQENITESSQNIIIEGGGGGVHDDDDNDQLLDASVLRMVEEAQGGSLSPSFILNRFLPDANALAAESTSSTFIYNYSSSSTSTTNSCGDILQVDEEAINYSGADSASRGPSSMIISSSTSTRAANYNYNKKSTKAKQQEEEEAADQSYCHREWFAGGYHHHHQYNYQQLRRPPPNNEQSIMRISSINSTSSRGISNSKAVYCGLENIFSNFSWRMKMKHRRQLSSCGAVNNPLVLSSHHHHHHK